MNYYVKSFLLTPFNLLYKSSPQIGLRVLFRIKCGYKLNLQKPKTYNEKIQWIKLFDRNPLMPKCGDKYLVREYVESKGLGFLLNELLWEGSDPESIPFSDLPSRCVFKATHGSGFNLICEDISQLNTGRAVRTFRRWLKTKYLPSYGEWFYGVEPPRIIVEAYLGEASEKLRNYKVYCFHGKARFLGVDYEDGQKGHVKNVYDTAWNLMPGYRMAYPCTDIAEEKPDCLDELLKYAQRLSEDFIHARVDFYIVDGRIYFGEITFSNSAGFGTIQPDSFSNEMGALIHLPIE